MPGRDARALRRRATSWPSAEIVVRTPCVAEEIVRRTSEVVEVAALEVVEVAGKISGVAEVAGENWPPEVPHNLASRDSV